MKHEVPFSLKDPINPIVYKWVDQIPEIWRNCQGLFDFLVHLASWNYEHGHTAEGCNPFYKIVELLDADKLYYSDLITMKEYYHFDIIRYLIQDNLAETYVCHPCHCPNDLKRALSGRNNCTGKYALAEILAKII